MKCREKQSFNLTLGRTAAPRLNLLPVCSKLSKYKTTRAFVPLSEVHVSDRKGKGDTGERSICISSSPPPSSALKQGLHCIPGWPQTPYVAKDDLELLILFLYLLSAGIARRHRHAHFTHFILLPHAKVHPLIREEVLKADPRSTARSCQIWFDIGLPHGCHRASLFHLKTMVPL